MLTVHNRTLPNLAGVFSSFVPMAVSFNSYLAKPQDATLLLDTGEVVSLRPNDEVFDMSGHLKGHNRLTAGKESHWFTLSWPRLAAKHVSTLSKWRLVITKATDDRITSFYKDTAANLGSDNWNVVKSVVADCRAKFHARLLSMSNQEIVFSHEDQQSAEKMKNSNQMVDIMNTLLAHVDNAFCDILVDWEVKVTPVTVSLSYQPFNEESDREFDSVLLTDADSPSATNSTVSRASTEKGELPSHFQRMADMISAESWKTRVALDRMAKEMERMAKENSNRHRFICQKIEELKSSVGQHQLVQGFDEDDGNGLGELESDQNYATEGENADDGEDESMPSSELFGYSDGASASSHQGKKSSSHSRDQQRESFQSNGSRQSGAAHAGHSERSHRSSHHSHSRPPPSSEKSTTNVWRREDSAKPSEAHQDSLSGSELENRNLDEAVERAYIHEDPRPPVAKSYYTILCLDVSASMEENGGLEEMKELVDQFINGVEDVVNDTGVEENIGLVTFGGTSNVVQNLTNDFSRVRDAIDNIEAEGRSPFVQALLVSMAAFVDKAGIISVSGVYDVKPRIIFISDGYPTENHNNGGADYAYNKMHVRTGLTRLMMNFAHKEKYSKVQPVVFIPVGRKPDKELMKSMATLSGGVYMEPKDVGKLCTHYIAQETIGKTLALLRDTEDYPEPQIAALATGIWPAMNEEQKAEVVRRVQEEKKTPSKKHRNRPSNFEDVFEDRDKVNGGELLPLGTRVVRGPDWHWGNQDHEGPGTVIHHSTKNEWTHVAWDHGGCNRYGYGGSMGYQIWKTDDYPRLMGESQDLEIGMTVEKGPNWDYTEERLHNIGTGVIIRKSRSKKKLMVRWDNAEIQEVRWGADDKYDVMYCDPLLIQKEAPFAFPGLGSADAKVYHQEFVVAHRDPLTRDGMAAQEFEDGQWQWKGDDEVWNDYSLVDNTNIEKNYKRKRDGTCVITRDGKSRRIMFRRNTEKNIETGVECAVQRVQISVS